MNTNPVKYLATFTLPEKKFKNILVPNCGHLVLASKAIYDSWLPKSKRGYTINPLVDYKCCECDAEVGSEKWEHASSHFGGCCHAF